MTKIQCLKAFAAMVVIKKVLMWLLAFILTLLVTIFPSIKERGHEVFSVVPQNVFYVGGYILGLSVSFFIFKWCVEFFMLSKPKQNKTIANKSSDSA